MTPADDSFRCDCSSRQLRLRRLKNQSIIAGEQCLRCGRCAVRVPKSELTTQELPWWDEALEPAWRQKVTEHYQRKHEAFLQEQRDRDEAFWRLYDSHLKSPKWNSLRRKVMIRSRGVCEGCAEAQAVQVHHLTYERLGDEMLFDLAAVCLACHEKIHGKEIGGSR